MGHIFPRLNISNCSGTEDFDIEAPPTSDNTELPSSLNPSTTLIDNHNDESAPYDSGDDCTIIHEDKQSILPFPPQFIAKKQLPLDEIFLEVTERLNFQYEIARNRESRESYANGQINTSSIDETSAPPLTQDKLRLRKKV
ncbi:MAG: hypothetical protein AB7D28_06175 [Candidatus Berkiella sp.]